MKRRISLRSTCLVLCILDGAGLTGCGGTPNPSEALGVNRSPIVNGAEDQDPADIGVADVRDVTAGRDGQAGTAVFLTNDWLLSAKHIINHKNVLGVGDLLPEFKVNKERHRPDPLLVFEHPTRDVALARLPQLPAPEAFTLRGSPTGYQRPLAGYADAKAVVSAVANDGGAACFGFGPNTSGGAGAGLLRDGIFPLFTATAADGPHIFRTRDSATSMDHSGGDSGGPCLEQAGGDILGIHFDRIGSQFVLGDGIGNIPAPTGREESVSGFRDWANRILNSRVAVQGDVDGDALLDTVTVGPDNNGFLQFTVDFGTDTQFTLPTVIPDALVAPAVAVSGDFNHDGEDDWVAFFGGAPFYYDGLPQLVPIVHVDSIFAPPETDYTSLRAADFNGDGFSDIEALLPATSASAAARVRSLAATQPVSGTGVDVYYGSGQGLTTATAMEGFPSAESNDGRFLTLAVQPQKSIGIPNYLFRLETMHDVGVAVGDLHLEIFDGDLSGSHDTVVTNGQATHTCYQLYADPLGDGSGETPSSLLVSKDDTAFANNAWSSLVDGPSEFANAHVPGSASTTTGQLYSYLLRVFISTNPCDQAPLAPTDPVANAIKIRANGLLEFVSSVDPVNSVGGAISIRGSDSNGDFSALDGCTPETCTVLETQDVDTAYDGTWTFLIPTTLSEDPSSPTLTDLWIAEADADSTLDTRSPGQSTGASADINFAIDNFDINGASLGQLFAPPHPSGQFDPTTEPCIAYDLTPASPATQLDPLLEWNWASVPTHNNIWLAVPTTTPPTCVAPEAFASAALSTVAVPVARSATLPLHAGSRRYKVRETTASPEAFWSSPSGSRQIAEFLPLSLGAGARCGRHEEEHGKRITNTREALEILKEATHSRHLATTQQEIEEELLTAKLNVARALRKGERIDKAFIYGTTSLVTDVIKQADAVLASARDGDRDDRDDDRRDEDRNHGCAHHEPTQLELLGVVTLLEAFNAGSVTHWPPVATVPLASAAALRGAASSLDGGALFWRHD